jgi:hypothetical protein
MDSTEFYLFAFHTNGDIASADADEDLESMLHALQDGVNYANGGRLLKHYGVPCITLPMGTLEGQQMPVDLTFACKAYADNDMLRYASAYEAASQSRTIPGLTPAIPSDHLSLVSLGGGGSLVAKPLLKISSVRWVPSETSGSEICRQFSVTGTVQTTDSAMGIHSVQVFVDGRKESDIVLKGEQWE